MVVVDDAAASSPFFAKLKDDRVRYIRTPPPPKVPPPGRAAKQAIISVGAKRNLAIAEARGQVIAHFDDDDCYGPAYLDVMVSKLLGSGEGRKSRGPGFDLVKLVAWYNFDVETGVMGRSDFEGRLPFPACKQREDYRKSYGWSYVYRRALAACVPFPDTCWGEDACFIGTALNFGCRVCQMSDREGVALHTLHGGSTSRLICQEYTPPSAPQRAAGHHLNEAVSALISSAALGKVADAWQGDAGGAPRNLFCWDVHAKRKFWAEGVPMDGEGEMCVEFGEWMQGNIQRDRDANYPGRPEGFRCEMQRRAASASAGAAVAHFPQASPLELPSGAKRAILQLGLAQRPPGGGRVRTQPLPLEWVPVAHAVAPGGAMH
jgi:hypothetical protein